MARKRIKHKRIPNEGKRNATFGKRSDGLLKKANELSTLCGVDIAIVVHKKRENNVILWPSPAIFRERVQIFFDFSNMERERRMGTHEKYMEQTTKSETEDLLKLKRTTKLKESQQFLNELTHSKYFDGLHLNQLNSLNSLTNDMLKKLQKRDYELNNEQQQVQLLPLPSPLPLSTRLLPSLSFGMVSVTQQHTNIGGGSKILVGGMNMPPSPNNNSAP